MKFNTTYLGKWALSQEESPVVALCEKLHKEFMAEQEEKLAACIVERRNDMNEFTIVVTDIPCEKYAEYRQEVVDRLHNNRQYVRSGERSKYLLHTMNGRLWLIPSGCMGGGMHIMADCALTARIHTPLSVVNKVIEYEPKAAKADVKATTNLYEQGLAICKKMSRTSHMSSIKNVIFNPPATIVLWSDGTKTVVKAQGTDSFDKTTGLAMAIAKKHFGNDPYFNEIFRKWIPEYDTVKYSHSYDWHDDEETVYPNSVVPDKLSGSVDAKQFQDICNARIASKHEEVDKADKDVTEPKPETCRERLKREHPEKIDPDTLGGCIGCPGEYGYASPSDFCHDMSMDCQTACTKCWDRPVEKKKTEPERIPPCDAEHFDIKPADKDRFADIPQKPKRMTFREKLAKEHPEMIDPASIGGCVNCPYQYGYEPCIPSTCKVGEETCRACWDREIPE